MLDELCSITGIDRNVLLQEYKMQHQKHGSVEYPFVTLELPSIKAKYSNYSNEEIKNTLGEAFHRFNSIRKKTLILYDGVSETLKYLSEKNIIIIGYTESAQENGLYRLKKLNISQYFKHVYSSQSQYTNNYPIDIKARTVTVKKPNKDILLNICKAEGCAIDEAVYIGDSLTKDVYMAKQAGITAVWVNYPKESNNYYNMLVDITSWTDEDFQREAKLKQEYLLKDVHPDYEINNFSQLSNILISQ